MPEMHRQIVLASQNPVKVRATLNGFKRMFSGITFEIETVAVSSNVRDQPLSDTETLQGALNRARNASLLKPHAEFWVGIEGGIEDINGELAGFAWVVVLSAKRIGKGRTAAFILPQKVTDLIRQGLELGEADDRIFQRSNSKQDNGAVGILTADVIDRCALYEQAVIIALIPFKNPAFYPEHPD
jgi:inosine/xanthosine triphosphatase